MKVFFFGNHTVGVSALKALVKKVDVLGVVAHPEDEEDGVRYESVYDFAYAQGIPAIRGKGKQESVREFLIKGNPDLIWVTDYRYLLPDSLLSIPKFGGVNLHPSLLPKYRGRAPLNWAIINGEKETGITAHYLTSRMDDGGVIDQRQCSIDDDEYVGDVLNKLMPKYYDITMDVIQRFIDGNVKSNKQNEAESTTYKARKPEDGRVSWKETAVQIRNLIRAVSEPYPGAYAEWNGVKIYLWRAEVSDFAIAGNENSAGTIIKVENDAFIVACADKALKVLKYTLEPTKEQLIHLGMVLS